MGETRIYVQVCVYVAFIIAVVTADQGNDNFPCPGPLKYYMDLGCTPVYENKIFGGICAVRFDCNHLKKRFKDKCYINGHEYDHNQILNKEDANVCDSYCICKRSHYLNEIAAFHCDDIKCPKLQDVRRGCYLQRDPSKCCKDPKEICPENIKDRPVCIVNDKKYYDGETFEVQDEPDLTCICQPGYEGKNVPPFCVKFNRSPCGHPAFNHIDHFRQNCAPVFVFNDETTKATCYKSMKCHDSKDAIMPPFETPFVMEDLNNMCLFGNMMIRIGEKLQPALDSLLNCVHCICEVPPTLSCKYVPENECKFRFPSS